MKVSYNWLKWYVPEIPDALGRSPMGEAEKLADIITYHLAEVETVEKHGDDSILDIKILPNRAHDLLSHLGIARELSSLLHIPFVDPTPKYKIPESHPTKLEIKVETDKCRRYMGRIVRNVTVGPSPDWVVKHLEAIGQRSIHNVVDVANLVMFNCGQPTHVFDLDKMESQIIVREAENGEKMTTLDNREMVFKNSHMIIADEKHVLGIAGIKGGKIAEVNENTKNLIIEVANFDPTSVRKTAQALNIFTDAKKRFENDLSPELAPWGMRELSALIAEMCPEAVFEDIVDVYPMGSQPERKLAFSLKRMESILGTQIAATDVEDILKRYHIEYKFNPSQPSLVREGEKTTPPDKGDTGGLFEITVPTMRLDLTIEEDMAEEIGRIMGYDKVKGNIPKINFEPKVNETYAKIQKARAYLLSQGYSEVMTYAFRDKGDIEVMQSASDKKFLRTNLADDLAESLKLNKINAPLLGLTEVKIFEIGNVFTKSGEETHVAYNEKNKIIEKNLHEFQY